jgi:hypothetical protein
MHAEELAITSCKRKLRHEYFKALPLHVTAYFGILVGAARNRLIVPDQIWRSGSLLRTVEENFRQWHFGGWEVSGIQKDAGDRTARKS